MVYGTTAAKVPLLQQRAARMSASEPLANTEEKLSLTMSNTGHLQYAQPGTRRTRYVRNPRSKSWQERRVRDPGRREVRINGALQLQRLADAIIENSDEQ